MMKDISHGANSLDFTGERYLPEVGGNIELEHLHRYLLAKQAVVGKTVLDIASGEGYGSAMLAESARRVTGVDISQEAVSHAQTKYRAENLEFRLGSCSVIPLGDASVDVVVSFETIEHHDEHEAMMREIKRVLRPDGVMIISSPDKLEYSDKPGYRNPYHIHELYRDEFRKLLDLYFKNHSIYGQRVVYGSAIFLENGISTVESYELSSNALSTIAGVPYPVYLIAVASDAELPSLGSGILEQPINETDVVKGWTGAVAERDAQLARLNQAMAERDDQIARLQSEITDIYASTSWRVTSPLRAVKSILVPSIANDRPKMLGRFARSFWFNNLLRRIYRTLPLPWHVKQQLKRIYLRPLGANKIENKQSLQLAQSSDTLPVLMALANQFKANERWVLIIDARIPTPDQDSGSVRMSAILRLLQEMGFSITFASDSEDYLSNQQNVLKERGIFVLQGRQATQHHLASEGGKYHFVLLSRPETAFHYLPYARAYALYSKIIYDMVDLHWLRFEREMEISGDSNLITVIEHFRRIELLNSTCADLVLAITDEEKERLLVEQPDTKVAILPNIHETYPPKTSFDKRRGLLFIGGFWHKPNEDAVIFFVNDVLPSLINKIPDLIFYIIGSNMPASVTSLRSANVNPLGFVPDVAPYFESCRVFVAPLRFGAGMKGKVGQSMSHGLPIVATKIGAEGMGLRHETEILIADGPQDFANSVNRLYSDEILWRKLSHNGLAHVEANYSLVTSRKRMADIFSPTQSESVFPANEWPKGGHPANSTYPARSVEQSVTREVDR